MLADEPLSPEALEVVASPGERPVLWQDRSVVFFANLLSMFFGNEAETAALEDEIRCVDSYGGRLVPIIGLMFPQGDNVLVLERAADAVLVRYFRDELGLPLPELRVLSHADYLRLGQGGDSVMDELKTLAGQWVDGFVTDAPLAAVAAGLGRQTLSTLEGSRRGNNKLLLHRHLAAQRLPVFDTVEIGAAEDLPAALSELAARGFEQAVVKAAIGASGIGLMKVATQGNAKPVPAMYFHEGPCMVQGWMQAGRDGVRRIHSPSVQMFAGERQVLLYDLTEQILGHDSVHEGNEAPPPYLDDLPGLKDELMRQAEVTGRWLHAQGYRGTASTDFLVAENDDGGLEVIVCEINARVTGATYPSLLARHFVPHGAWLMRNLQLRRPVRSRSILSILRRHGDLFVAGSRSGILPINFNLTPDNRVEKGQFLCVAPTAGECRALLERAEQELPVDWEYVRD